MSNSKQLPLDANNNFDGNGSCPLAQVAAAAAVAGSPSSDHLEHHRSCHAPNCDATEFDRFANQCSCECLNKAYADVKQQKGACEVVLSPPANAKKENSDGPLKITLRQLVEQSVSLMIDQLICNELWPKLPAIIAQHRSSSPKKDEVPTPSKPSKPPELTETETAEPPPPPPVMKPRNLVTIRMPIDVRTQSPVWFTRCDMADLAQKSVSCLLDMSGGHVSKSGSKQSLITPPVTAVTTSTSSTAAPFSSSSTCATGKQMPSAATTQQAVSSSSTFVPVHTMRAIPSFVQADLRLVENENEKEQPPSKQAAIPVKKCTTLAQMPDFLQPVIEIKAAAKAAVEVTTAATASSVSSTSSIVPKSAPSKEGKSSGEAVKTEFSAAQILPEQSTVELQQQQQQKTPTLLPPEAAATTPRPPLDLTGFEVAATEVSQIASRFHRRMITYAELLEFPLVVTVDFYYISGFTPREEVAYLPPAPPAPPPAIQLPPPPPQHAAPVSTATSTSQHYRPLVIKSATTAIGPLLSFPHWGATDDLLTSPDAAVLESPRIGDDLVTQPALLQPPPTVAVPVIAEPEPPTPAVQQPPPETPVSPVGVPLLARSERLHSEERHEAMPHPEAEEEGRSGHKSPGQQYHYRYRRRRKTQLWGGDGNSDDDSRSFSYNIQQSKSTGHLHRSFYQQNEAAEIEPKGYPPPTVPVPPPPPGLYQQQNQHHQFTSYHHQHHPNQLSWAPSSAGGSSTTSHLGIDLIGSYVSTCFSFFVCFCGFLPFLLDPFPVFAILPCFGLIRFADADSVIVLQCYFYYHVSLPLTRCRPALGADALSLSLSLSVLLLLLLILRKQKATERFLLKQKSALRLPFHGSVMLSLALRFAASEMSLCAGISLCCCCCTKQPVVMVVMCAW